MFLSKEREEIGQNKNKKAKGNFDGEQGRLGIRTGEALLTQFVSSSICWSTVIQLGRQGFKQTDWDVPMCERKHFTQVSSSGIHTRGIRSKMTIVISKRPRGQMVVSKAVNRDSIPRVSHHKPNSAY